MERLKQALEGKKMQLNNRTYRMDFVIAEDKT